MKARISLPALIGAGVLTALPAAAQAPGRAGMASMVGTFIRVGAALLAFLFVLQLLRGIFLMLTHGDNEERKAVAKETLFGAVIGFAVVMVTAAVAAPATAKAVSFATGMFARYFH
jgi:hypothetical protein